MILYICSFISNHPRPENEHLTNYEVAKMLELDNFTIENYVVGLRAFVTILSVRNYRQIIFRCKNNSNIHQVAPMPETSMPDRTIQNI
uniref:DDE_Tnp_1_7 domain-containing protein n=1 Tax=Meloidogyne hapla TaxID=6305 RepID=A0A1I8AZD0_MELHA